MLLFFFFKQKTAYEVKECDWSSDVCSSDLSEEVVPRPASDVSPVVSGQESGGLLKSWGLVLCQLLILG